MSAFPGPIMMSGVPQLRALPLNDASIRALLGMPHGPAGTGKAAAEQKLLDAALEHYPHLFTTGRIWLTGRIWHGPAHQAHARPDPGEKRHYAEKDQPGPGRRLLSRGTARRRRHDHRPRHRVLR